MKFSEELKHPFASLLNHGHSSLHFLNLDLHSLHRIDFQEVIQHERCAQQCDRDGARKSSRILPHRHAAQNEQWHSSDNAHQQLDMFRRQNRAGKQEAVDLNWKRAFLFISCCLNTDPTSDVNSEPLQLTRFCDAVVRKGSKGSLFFISCLRVLSSLDPSPQASQTKNLSRHMRDLLPFLTQSRSFLLCFLDMVAKKPYFFCLRTVPNKLSNFSC
mmetsp:Transcript_121784/g.171343  ORF Transcript_121784/g.171343 Transcript_121784/m.171343 type:complete len:215 (+) Transcript_121784:376-1020(+)